LHWRATLRGTGRSGARRRRCVYRPRTSLRRDHSSLLHNRLARYGLGRRRWCSLRARRSGGRSSRGLRLCGWRRCCCCRRIYGRRDHNCGRSGRLFNWRRRNHGRRRRLDHGRCDHNTSFRCRCSRFGGYNGWLFRCWRRCRSRRFYGRGWSSRLGNNGRRPGWRRGWLMLLLLFLPEQSHHVAGLGDLRKVDLRFYFRGGRPLPRRRAGLGGNVLSYTFRFILLN
jgi:hypothetical protein